MERSWELGQGSARGLEECLGVAVGGHVRCWCVLAEALEAMLLQQA